MVLSVPASSSIQVMAKAKRQSAHSTASSDGARKEKIIDDSVQPKELNFSNLSAKIRTQFQSLEEERKKGSQKTHKQQKNRRFQDFHVEPGKVAHSKQSSGVTASRGKKRGHNGEVLPKLSTISTKAADGDKVADDGIVQEEVFALGGTAEDISLINGIQSESDIENGEETQEEDEDNAQRKFGLQKGMT